ncbi:unnamed protein product [Durusdinium trenchii]|uniref:SGNH hydrolase-type esterase domain-containing protein n=1 Tax=Durusdinium trenchii TaxID=1381693 RepID=A0ABP0IGE6_9DINO
MASEVALGGHKRRSRGVAQQIRQASQILLKEDWQDSCTLVIVGPVINDFLFHGTVAIGSTAEEAITSPYVSNHRQILADLLDIGVDMDRIIFTGFPGIECAPFCENFDVDLEWFRRQQALGPRRWRLELLDFANNFLVRPHSDSPVKTELLLHRQTTFAARRVRSINCSRVA